MMFNAFGIVGAKERDVVLAVGSTIDGLKARFPARCFARLWPLAAQA
jgi:hypothetical protein